MHYLFLKFLLENPPLRNLNINMGLLKCCLVMYLSFNFMFLFTFYVCMCVCAHMDTMVCMWTPDESL